MQVVDDGDRLAGPVAGGGQDVPVILDPDQPAADGAEQDLRAGMGGVVMQVLAREHAVRVLEEGPGYPLFAQVSAGHAARDIVHQVVASFVHGLAPCDCRCSTIRRACRTLPRVRQLPWPSRG